MKNFTLVWFCALLVTVSAVQAAEISAPTSLDVYGFASLNAETNQKFDHNWRWARVGLKAHPYSAVLKDTFLTRFEYDLSTSAMKYAYVQFDRDWRGGQASLVLGQSLNPIQFFYPGPAGLPLTRWPDAEGNFSVYCPGAALYYEYKLFEFKAVSFGQGQFATTLSLGTLSMGWEESVGHTVVFAGDHLGKYLENLFIGWAHFDDDDLGHAFFVQDHWKVWHPSLQLYAQYDFGDQTEAWLTGLSWVYSKNSFVKVFYDAKVGNWKGGELKAEITFAF
jgi:hypothetical protein